MQKRAFQGRAEAYKTVYEPLPTDKETAVFRDREPAVLPYAEDFPKLHFHDRYEIGICIGGEGLFLSEGDFFSISEGDAVLIPPGIRHYSRSIDPAHPCLCRFAYILPSKLLFHLSRLCADAERLVTEPTHPSVLHGKETREIHEAFEALGKNADAVALLHLCILLLTPSEQTKKPSDVPTGVESELAEYLSLHYDENEEAKALAARYHLSESQLRRKFVAAYGMPPIAYRNDLRCRIGAELLLRTDTAVNAISERLGFSSPTEFYRSFHKRNGISPTQYRKNGKR